jgi:uncharacterized iron-regulated protein
MTAFSLVTLGCAHGGARILDLEIGDPDRKTRQVALEVDAIVDTRRDEIISPQVLVERLAGARTVLIAEEHTNLDHHRVQLRVLELLHATGRSLTIGLEMFPVSDQSVLDDWTAGALDETEFLEQTDWYGGWGYDWDYYRDILVFARINRIPLVALNAPRELIAEVRTTGLAAARRDRNAELPPSVLPATADHRMLISNFFETDDPVHGALPEEQMNALLEAQCTWDAVMAYSASKSLAEDPTRTMVILAGTGHVAYGLGIARQLTQWLEDDLAIIVPVAVDETTNSAQASLGDFIWGLPNAANPAFPTLGALTSQSDDGAVIIYIEPDSPAVLADLQAGDILTRLLGQPVSSRRELNRIVATFEWGDEILATVLRDGVELEVAVSLRR